MIIDIVRSNFKIIIFGFVFTFFSCIGQSFFIGLFNSNIREELNITHGPFGSIYGIATLCSSLTLIWLGKKIDDLKLVNYSFLVVIFLSLAALFFSFVNGLIFLAIGIFFLRLSGQGLMAHTASVAISRFFDRSRGKALSCVWVGMSFGEFLLPIIIVYFLTFIYWRNLWQVFAIIIILLLPIFTYLTIKEISIFSRENKNGDNVNKNIDIIKSWINIFFNYDPNTWEMEITARRIIAWSSNTDITLENADKTYKEKFFLSLIKQTNFLSKNLKNLFYNPSKIICCAAIILSGMMFKEYDSSYKIGIKELEKIIKNYFDDTGFPKSRNPEELFICIKYLILIREWHKESQRPIPGFLDGIISKCGNCYALLSCSNKQFPLFNGATEINYKDYDIFLKNLKYFIIDCLRIKPHPSHFCFDEVLSILKEIKPKKIRTKIFFNV